MGYKPSVLIHVGTIENFGDQMMLVSAAQAVCQRWPGASIHLSVGNCVAWTPAQLIRMVRQAGVTSVLHTDYFFTHSMKVKIRKAAGEIYRDLCRMDLRAVFTDIVEALRLFRRHTFSHILLASGYTFGDNWGVANAQRYLRHIIKWKSHNPSLKLVLLPQAFGPFADLRLIECMYSIIKNTDIVFARDNLSYDALLSLNSDKEILLSGDFTLPLTVSVSSDMQPYALIIPSVKMDSPTYIHYLGTIYQRLKANGVAVYVANHTNHKGDFEVIHKLAQEYDVPVKLLPDYVSVKQLIKGARLVVSSRYHSIVSALSQSVPAIILGWSHKYDEIAHDYGVEEYVVDMNQDVQHAIQMADRLCDDAQRGRIVSALTGAAQKQLNDIDMMWQQVGSLFPPPAK